MKFENKREEKKCLLLVHTNADKGLRQFFFDRDGYSPRNLHLPDLESAAWKIYVGSQLESRNPYFRLEYLCFKMTKHTFVNEITAP